MTKRAAVTEAEARRVIKAALDCGLLIREVVVSVDCVRLVTDPEPKVPVKSPDMLEKWGS